MSRQFPDKKTVGIPPDFVAYRNDTEKFKDQAKSYADQAAGLVDASKALVDAEIERCEAFRRKCSEAEWKRVIAENARVAAECEREQTIVTLSAELEGCRRGLNALGALVNSRDYMLLGDTLHLSPRVAAFEDGTLRLFGAELADGVLIIDGQLYY